MLFYINNTITAVCQVLSGHQAVLVLEAVYKHAINSRTIGLSSTNDKLIYNHDPNIVILSVNSYVWVLLKDSSSAH